MKLVVTATATLALSLFVVDAHAQTMVPSYDGVYGGHMTSAAGTCTLNPSEFRVVVQGSSATMWSQKLSSSFTGPVGRNGEGIMRSPNGLALKFTINGKNAHLHYENDGCIQDSDLALLE